MSNTVPQGDPQQRAEDLEPQVSRPVFFVDGKCPCGKLMRDHEKRELIRGSKGQTISVRCLMKKMANA